MAKIFTGTTDTVVFDESITAANLSGTNTGDATIGTANGLSLSAQALSLAAAVASGSAGALTGADKAKLDAITGTHTGTNTGDVTLGATSNGLSVTGQVLSLAAAIASGAGGALTGADKAKLDAITGTHTGTNTGDVTLSAFGSTPNANGASLSSQALTLQPADGSNPGGVSTAPQTFAGAKTLTHVLSSSVASGSNAHSLLDGARFNFSTADSNAYLYRSASNMIRTPGSLTVDSGLTVSANIGASSSGGPVVTVRQTGQQVIVLDATHQALLLDASGTTTLAGNFVRSDPNASSLTLTFGYGRNSSTAAISADTFANTSVGQKCMLVRPQFSPASGSASFAGLLISPTVNGVSSGKAAGLVVAPITNTLTGGTQYLADFGTTTTDYHTGYTQRACIDINGQGRFASIGVGNSASATVAVGSLAKKIEVFDAAGSSLGFVPIYSSIT